MCQIPQLKQHTLSWTAWKVVTVTPEGKNRLSKNNFKVFLLLCVPSPAPCDDISRSQHGKHRHLRLREWLRCLDKLRGGMQVICWDHPNQHGPESWAEAHKPMPRPENASPLQELTTARSPPQPGARVFLSVSKLPVTKPLGPLK